MARVLVGCTLKRLLGGVGGYFVRVRILLQEMEPTQHRNLSPLLSPLEVIVRFKHWFEAVLRLEAAVYGVSLINRGVLYWHRPLVRIVHFLEKCCV